MPWTTRGERDRSEDQQQLAAEDREAARRHVPVEQLHGLFAGPRRTRLSGDVPVAAVAVVSAPLPSRTRSARARAPSSCRGPTSARSIAGFGVTPARTIISTPSAIGASDVHVGQRRDRRHVDEDAVEPRAQRVEHAAHRRRAEQLGRMHRRRARRAAASGGDPAASTSASFERRAPPISTSVSPGRLGDAEQPVHRRAPQVGVDEQHALLELLRHRQREVRGGQALAVALVRAGDDDGADRASVLGALDARPQRAVLLGGERLRRERRDEVRVELVLRDGLFGLDRRRRSRPASTRARRGVAAPASDAAAAARWRRRPPAAAITPSSTSRACGGRCRRARPCSGCPECGS